MGWGLFLPENRRGYAGEASGTRNQKLADSLADPGWCLKVVASFWHGMAWHDMALEGRISLVSVASTT